MRGPINAWRAEMNRNISNSCPSCEPEVAKTVLHRFWHCHRAVKAWEYAFKFLYSFNKRPASEGGTLKALSVEQSLSNKELPEGV
jgi:hypothetical protein